MALSFPQTLKSHLRDFGICLSLGNLCLIRRWYDLEHLQERSVNYYRTGPADPTLLIATIIASFVIALVIWLLWRVAQLTPSTRIKTMARGVFLALLILPLESIRRYWNQQAGSVDWGSNLALVGLELTLVLGMFLAFRGNPRVLRAARQVAFAMILLLPALLLDFAGQRATAESASAFASKAALPLLVHENDSPRQTRRVVWLLFDEFDQRLAFDARPAGLELPELDRLRDESLVANQTVQTASWTALAVPSLISGKSFGKAQMMDSSTLLLFTDGSKHGTDWSDQNHIFKKVRARGLNAAIVGWHHPYCRVLGDTVNRCFDMPSGHPTDALLRETHAAEEGVWGTVAFLFRLQMENFRDLFRPDANSMSNLMKQEYVQQRQQRQYFAIRDRAYRDAVDPSVEFLYAHFPAPHLYAIYDRRKKDFALSLNTDYLDNLALVDRTVGELRLELERAGLWESTSILVSSDHGLRPDEWRGKLNWTEEMNRLTSDGASQTVPFILKLAGSSVPEAYGDRVSAVVSGDLMLSIAAGEVKTLEDAKAWLSRHADPQRLTKR